MTVQFPPAPAPAEPGARRFDGQVAFITGAASDQGRAVAATFAAEGADIIALDFSTGESPGGCSWPAPGDLAATARLVEGHGRRAVTSLCDVRDFTAVAGALERGVAEFGHLDVVVTNAGTASLAPTWEIALEDWDFTISVNLTSVFYAARAAIPVMINQGTGGAIVLTNSVAGLQGLPLLADLSASRHGVAGLAKSLASELARYRIRVNSVYPRGLGADLDPGARELLEHDSEFASFYLSTLPDQGSEAEAVAATVAWLASSEALHITGIQLPADGDRARR